MEHAKQVFVMQAAYKIGGRSVNAYAIEQSILGCRSHSPVKVRPIITLGENFISL
jgi:hypothetical protein